MSPRPSGATQLVALARVLLRAFGSAVVTVWALGSLVFLAGHALPSDPVALILGDNASLAERRQLEHALHLDLPLGHQYAYFLAGLARLDFGDSLRRPGVSALARAGAALIPTAELALLGVGLGAVGGVLLALAVRGPWLGRARRALSLAIDAASAVPLLALAPVLTFVLCITLRWLPLPGDPEARFAGTSFAAALLAVPLGLHVARISRALLEQSQRSQYVQVARSKGAGELRTLGLHALPPVSAPLTTVIATQFGALLGGAAVLEKLFERFGLGTLLVEAYGARDLPVLEASVVLSGLLFALVQGAGTVLQAVVDPRVRS